jgi:hypothetical protein
MTDGLIIRIADLAPYLRRMIQICLLLCSVVIITLTGAYFSVSGLMAMFSASPGPIAIMALGLELSKFAAASYLHRRWSSLNRLVMMYMFLSVVILSLITSVGIYGFLTAAHQKATYGLLRNNLEIERIRSQIGDVAGQIQELKDSVSVLPLTWVSKRVAAQNAVSNRLDQLRNKQAELNTSLADNKKSELQLGYDVGPLMFFSKTIGRPIDTVAEWLVLAIVLVFDPLAICLVLALFSDIEHHRKVPIDVHVANLVGAGPDHHEQSALASEPSLSAQILPHSSVTSEARPARRVFTPEEKAELIAGYKSSGLSLSKYAASKRMSKSMIHSWITKNG